MAVTATRSGYTLPSTTRSCAATGREIATGETYVAALVQEGSAAGGGGATGGQEEFRRIDFSLDAWTAGARPVDARGRRLPLLGSWRSVMPAPGASRRMLIDDEALLDLFEQSAESPPDNTPDSPGEPAADPRVFRFMLALILIRKRLLVCEKTDRRGVMLVRPRGSPKSSEGGVLTEVEDPGLDESSVARVVTQLSAVLDGADTGSNTSGTPAATGGAA